MRAVATRVRTEQDVEKIENFKGTKLDLFQSDDVMTVRWSSMLHLLCRCLSLAGSISYCAGMTTNGARTYSSYF